MPVSFASDSVGFCEFQGLMHRSVCRKLFQNNQPGNQRLGNWELTFYLSKVEELALESKQLIFAFAASLIWLNITQIFHLPT